MSCDCRVNVHNEEGLTPMDIAQQNNFTDIITHLAGLKVHTKHCTYTELQVSKLLVY